MRKDHQHMTDRKPDPRNDDPASMVRDRSDELEEVDTPMPAVENQETGEKKRI